MGEIRARMDGLGLTRGYRYLLGGEELRRQESFATLRFALLLALLLVYMVMAAQFESLLHPFTVMLTIPMAGIGVSAFFFLLGQPLSVMAYIGIIILTGIAVDNGILLVDFANQLRRRGMGRTEALLAAGQARLRPILMTSLTTILGVLPLALGIGEGAELRAPLAWALLSGLTAATALTLVVLPVVYELIDRLRPARMREEARHQAEKTGFRLPPE
jgi:HAE1 family hydrophobic/amphiphilic exporter-1